MREMKTQLSADSAALCVLDKGSTGPSDAAQREPTDTKSDVLCQKRYQQIRNTGLLQTDPCLRFLEAEKSLLIHQR